eukprot:4091431-Pyramimonas_sp.AAC.1
MGLRWRAGGAGSLARPGSPTKCRRPPRTSAMPLDVGGAPLPHLQRGATEQRAEALGAIDLVDDDGAEDPMQGPGEEPNKIERLKREAQSRKHFDAPA